MSTCVRQYHVSSTFPLITLTRPLMRGAGSSFSAASSYARIPMHVPAAGQALMVVTLQDSNGAKLPRSSVFTSQLSIFIRNGPSTATYEQRLNDYRSTWVSEQARLAALRAR